MPIMYLGGCFYIVYFVKRCQHIVTDDTTRIPTFGELWLIVEVMVFFYQIFGGMVFVMLSYLSKVRPFMRDEFILENDTNPWNNKDTEDFLRHMKLEFYVTTLQITTIMMLLTFWFMPYFFHINLTAYGNRTFSITGVFMILCLIPRIWSLILTGFIASNGINLHSPRMRTGRLIYVGLNIFSFLAICSWKFLMNKELWEEENAFLHIWLPAELSFKILEPIYTIVKVLQV